MTMQVLEGIWEEIEQHAEDLAGRKIRDFILDNEIIPIKSKIIAAGLPVKDRTLENEWLAENRDKYNGKFVALDGNKLLAVSEMAKDAAEKATELGVEVALIIFVENSQNPRFISGGV